MKCESCICKVSQDTRRLRLISPLNIQSAARNEPQIWYNRVILSRKED